MSKWIEWKGGEMPDELTEKLVDVRFRSGEWIKAIKPQDVIWEHYESSRGLGHIIAYRLSTTN